MSTTLRRLTLKVLRTLGVKQFRALSGSGQPFICHLGDSNGENPYYNFGSSRTEIILMACWCRQFDEPLIFDVGGNVGFIATQLAQLLRERRPRIFSFEPVPFTFERLLSSVRLLELEEFVHPICSALSSEPSLARITYSEWHTMFAQMTEGEPNNRVGDKIAWCSVLTVDEVEAAVGGPPALIKVDVEGPEVKVLQGAANVLSGEHAPGICLESNPVTLSECNSSVRELSEQLTAYELFYVNDFEGQRMGFGQSIDDLNSIDWVCNIFAVPRTALGKKRWSGAVAEATKMLDGLRS
jgi:FkbM family methyltransferase